MRRNLAYVTCALLFLGACSSTPPVGEERGPTSPIDGPSAGEDGSGSGRGGASEDASGAPREGGGVGVPDGDGGEGPGQGASVLTAGVWDDNRNYEFFQRFLAGMGQGARAASFPSGDDEHAAARARFALPQGGKARLDVALVLDTTGSMGDELSYLQAEFDALSAAIGASFPNSEQRWSLVLYRDEGDEYVTRGFDFVGAGELAQFRQRLGEQRADGGGDLPEAPERGLAQAAEFSWRGDDTAKLLFWVADAPAHSENGPALVSAVRALVDRGVHLYPVASSGVDDHAELAMRSSAQLSGGRYLFLTDDSGVGGAHKEPRIPCYFVTKLDDAILRMVGIELSGEYREPAPADVVRVSGNVQAGRCALEDGAQAEAF